MKIISKYKDFYDGAQALGIDKTLIYKRFQNTYKVEELSKFNEFNESIWRNLPEPYMMSPTGEFYHTAKELINIEYSSIGFCGKLYPYIRFVKRINKKIVSRSTFYNAKKAGEFVSKLQSKFSKLEFMSEFYRCEKPTEEELKEYLNTNAFTKEKTEWFQKVNSPAFIFNEEPYIKDQKDNFQKVNNKSSLGYVLTNPILREFEFYKVMDNYSCYQALSQYIGGVLTEREIIKDNLTDIQKVAQHGFDKKYGFRTRPKNKNG